MKVFEYYSKFKTYLSQHYRHRRQPHLTILTTPSWQLSTLSPLSNERYALSYYSILTRSYTLFYQRPPTNHLQAVNSRHTSEGRFRQCRLRCRRSFPLRLHSLEDSINIDVGSLMLFITSNSINLSMIPQESPFIELSNKGNKPSRSLPLHSNADIWYDAHSDRPTPTSIGRSSSEDWLNVNDFNLGVVTFTGRIRYTFSPGFDINRARSCEAA